MVMFSETSAKERVMRILSQLRQELGHDTLHGIENLTVMEGDLSAPNLGLSTEDYHTLCDKVDTIIHNGAVVNSVLPYAGM